MIPISEDQVKEWLKSKENIQNLVPDFVQLHSIHAVGGQGIVYFGSVNGKEAAVKVYFPDQLQQRVDREVDALCKLDCNSIVKILWYEKIKVFEYLLPIVATEFINGVNLDKFYLQNNISLNELGSIIYDIASAIDAMWIRRIVHRDLKPSNILIMNDGRACVIDLGLARHIDLSTLTAIGITWGTLGYLSPEQARISRQLTCKSDIYALGIIIVECALKRHPSNYDQLRLFSLGLEKKLPEPLESWKHSGIIKSMLNTDPIKRPKPQDLLASFLEYKKEDK